MGNYIGIYTNKEAIDTQVDGKTDALPYAFIDENTNVIYYNSTEEADAVPNYYSILAALIEGTETTSVPIPNGVTTIRNAAFRQASITGVEIPNSVTSIGQQAFYTCQQLTELYIPDSVTSIWNGRSTTDNSNLCAEDTALTTVHYPDNASITYFPRYAFSNCTSLTTINIPQAITYIGAYAFNNCSSLTVNISTLISQLVNGGIGDYAFNGAKVIGAINTTNLTSIPIYCFTGTNITSLTCPNVTTVFNNAFQNCKALTEVHFTNKLTLAGFYNGNNANRKNIFNGCSALTTVEFGTEATPNTVVTAFADSTFANCTSLVWDNIRFPTAINAFQASCFANDTHLGTNITLPSTIRTLGANCFSGCTGLEYVDASHVTTINGTCFNNTPNLQTVTLTVSVTFATGAFKNSGIRYITIAAGQTVAGFYNSNKILNIFEGCHNLHTISFAGNSAVTAFSNYTFYNCTSLRWKNITFPSAITTFQQYCFKGCTSLGPVVDLPPTLTTITNATFFGCTNIRMVVLPSTITTLTSNSNNNGCFGSCSNLFTFVIKKSTAVAPGAYFCQNIPTNSNGNRAYVPAGSLSAWQAQAGWGSTSSNTPYSRGFRLRELNANGKIPVTLSLTYASNTITIKEVYGGTVTVSSTHTATVFTRGESTSTSGVLSFTDEMFNFNQAITVTVGTHTANETVTVQYTPNTEYAPYVEAATGTIVIE